MTKTEAAELLGMKKSEIATVEDSPAGDIITTTDGTRVLNCVEPDAEGKTGLMFLAAPSETYGGNFPIYAQPGANASEPADGDSPPVKASIAVILEWVEGDADKAGLALALEEASKKPRAKLIDQLVAIRDGSAGDDEHAGDEEDDDDPSLSTGNPEGE